MRIAIPTLPMILLFSCGQAPEATTTEEDSNEVEAYSSATSQVTDENWYEGEDHFSNVRMLTNGGENAEAYFSFSDNAIVYQYTNEAEGVPCDQIYAARFNNDWTALEERQLVSTGKGRTTCSFFMGGDTLMIYASTHLSDEACPTPPDRSQGYVWPIYNTFEIFVTDGKGNHTQLTDNDFYDAEAVVSPSGDKILFTSTRNGDLDLYTMDPDGSNVKQITDGLGYDGGGFFGPKGEKIVFRASRPQTDEDINKYKTLLSQGLVAPSDMELYVCNTDGSDLRQVTDLGGANWAPYFYPSGEKIIFSSNHHSEKGFPFNLFMVNLDGSGLEQVSFDSMFDSFPMFSHDGTKLIFSSNRNNGGTRETNLFVADWQD